MGVTIEMQSYTCNECGGTFSYPEKYKHGNICPFCLKRDYKWLQGRRHEQDNKIHKQENVIRGLRSTITRLKNRR